MDIIELARRLDNLIRLGTIAEVDTAAKPAPLVRVSTGKLLTAWVPCFQIAAGAEQDVAAPSVGEGCLLLCPCGEPAQGFAFRGLPTEQHPSPDFTASQRVRRFADGALIRYDAETHKLEALLPPGATILVAAPGGMTVAGNLKVLGKVIATIDVEADGVSLKDHPTSGIRLGTETGGNPVATL